ncbi:conserved hypothetical protein [Gluconacetobacter diazotrophicus PA1 5]|uniref:Uncharacterized protein n=2 Tax=Gluconacetobacter diazotrophicus TaxID=33996 RepID=A0A7W4I773_GLUDI|nr:conserved hypothetical protein [Gluconacetobacter diazotrophicus PA1 5]MBB2157547.1 hypothetical protein [Gluconacetobacter diazotrophicus]TWB09426.1 hypothetical protein FBZ86_10488 [Gluconacetobacter diazotrophicus]CAP56512.1 putative membrane protein [Gluconacetobacter diazotrophicus PA1 5]
MTRIAVSIGAMLILSIFTICFAGGPLPVDLQSYYFASLALLVALCGGTAIVARVASHLR